MASDTPTNAIVTIQEQKLGNKERALLMGDLSKLTEEERGDLYSGLCRSCGLNPLTQPLSYIFLNGRWTFYFNKGGTDQLRSINRISICIVGRERIGDCYAVTAQATTPDGRTDTSTGIVAIAAGSKGDYLANLLMKAETKAKRRVTLSICGLGFLDDSELDTVEEYKTAEPPKIDLMPSETSEIIETHLDSPNYPTFEDEPVAAIKTEVSSEATEIDLNSEEMELAKDMAKSKTRKGTIGVTALIDSMEKIKKAKAREEKRAAAPVVDSPAANFKITWGKHTGKTLKEAPSGWLRYMIDDWYPTLENPSAKMKEFYKAGCDYLNAKTSGKVLPPAQVTGEVKDELPF